MSHNLVLENLEFHFVRRGQSSNLTPMKHGRNINNINNDKMLVCIKKL